MIHTPRSILCLLGIALVLAASSPADAGNDQLGSRPRIGLVLGGGGAKGGADNNSWALQLAIGRPIREGSIFDEIW